MFQALEGWQWKYLSPKPNEYKCRTPKEASGLAPDSYPSLLPMATFHSGTQGFNHQRALMPRPWTTDYFNLQIQGR